MRPEEQHRVAAEKRGENSRPVHALWRWGLRREGQTDSPSLTLWGPEGGAAAQARMILPAVQGNACNTAAAGAEPARDAGRSLRLLRAFNAHL